ncbi:hypothetical protein GUITHDRAFT_146044 [Guillardia theta CCMP2712]|uniref:RRM domain-containing protein n=1 Tax=Guillardia theta (strain CCMP2712) TaxID=905079 RepID=L1IJ30_GUITC|nr:hypothetical protein GUITHDRAFT_146044 [Guillardia theta CCMP2712]EKX36112.1 hypothetical protein GUITHDRAFT_146044 [Guillardia theta CCMP2712]|eukprot:XP_005823092.1 hypothetical protein GUITHDRAFT_146044 [Guillardia theta CCMP2712]
MCFKPCDKRLEELAWLRCSRCGNIVCHWSCVVKRTTVKQRKWLEAFMPYNDAPPVPCPNIHLESGELCCKAIVGCIREGGKSSVRKYADCKARQQEEQGMDSNMSSRVLLCRGLEEGVDSTALSALFSAYGEVEDCKVQNTPGKMDESEAMLVFADTLSAKRAVEQDKLPFKVELLRQGKKKSSREHGRHFISVKGIPSEVDASTIRNHFAHIGRVRHVELKQRHAEVFFDEDQQLSRNALLIRHVIDGSPVTITASKALLRSLGGYGRGEEEEEEAAKTRVNSKHVWKAMQAANVFDPSVFEVKEEAKKREEEEEEEELDLELYCAMIESKCSLNEHGDLNLDEEALARALEESARLKEEEEASYRELIEQAIEASTTRGKFTEGMEEEEELRRALEESARLKEEEEASYREQVDKLLEVSRAVEGREEKGTEVAMEEEKEGEGELRRALEESARLKEEEEASYRKLIEQAIEASTTGGKFTEGMEEEEELRRALEESARLKEEEEASYREQVDKLLEVSRAEAGGGCELEGRGGGGGEGEEERCMVEGLMAELRLVGMQEMEEEQVKALLRANKFNYDETINAILDAQTDK